MLQKIKLYYSLTKPGVLYGNVLTAAAGFLLASKGSINWVLFFWLILGTSLVIGSACVINNYLDVDIDQKMSRTKKRAIVSGLISPRNALIFGVILGLVGMAMLVAYTNLLVVIIGLTGFITYVFLYGALSKRKSMYGTAVGSVSGALPILAGYCGASGRLDIGAVLVFAILFFWQFPEFYSIAIFRQKEYKKAGVPVISVVKGIDAAKRQIFVYTVLFVISTLLLSIFGITGATYFAIMAVLGLYWIWLGYKGLKTPEAVKWSRSMFKFSLIILLVFSGLISAEAWLP